MRSYIPLLFLVLSIVACQPKEAHDYVSARQSLEPIDRLLAELSPKPQVFWLSSKKESHVWGKGGTFLKVKPQDYQTLDGSPIGDSIRLELLELGTHFELASYRIRTMMGNIQLESDGVYHLAIYSADGVPMKLNEGRTQYALFKAESDQPAFLFKGEQDPIGRFNFNQVGQRTRKTMDTLDVKGSIHPDTVNSKAVVSNYYPLQLDTLGWYGCLSYIINLNPLVTMRFRAADSNMVSARYMLVYPKIKSIMSASQWRDDIRATFEAVPANTPCTIIGLASIDGVPHLHFELIEPQKSYIEKLEFKPSSLEEIKSKLESL